MVGAKVAWMLSGTKSHSVIQLKEKCIAGERVMPHCFGEPSEGATVVVWITAEGKTKEGLNELNMWRTVPVQQSGSCSIVKVCFFIAHSTVAHSEIPLSHYWCSGVIRNGPPVWKWKRWKHFWTKLADWAANGQVWMPQALKSLCLI